MVIQVGATNNFDDKSTFEKVGDAITLGLPSAAVAAGVSIANTAIAFGNMFGNDSQRIETSDVVRRTLGKQHEDYYQDHTVGVEAAGFILGSLVPGGAAVKAVRTAQKSINASTRLATGFKRALVPNDFSKRIADDIYRKGPNDAFATLQNNKLKMIASGLHQNAIEAAAFEGAVLLTMNQNASITGEDLNYIQGITSNLGGAGLGLVLGTGIGGAISFGVDWGTATKQINNAAKLLKEAEIIRHEGRGGFIKGDAIRAPISSYYKAKDVVGADTFNKLTPAEQATWKETLYNAEQEVRIQLKEMIGSTIDEESKGAITEDLFRMLDSQEDLTEGMNKLNGVKSFLAIADGDILDTIPASPIRHMYDEDIRSYLKRINFPEDEIESTIQNNYGFMINDIIEKRVVGGKPADEFGIRGVSKISQEEDWENIFTWRHETGHVWLNDSARSLSAKSKLGARLIDQATKLSRMARPDNWFYVDSIAAKHAKGIELTPQEIKYFKYLNSTEELFADAYSIVTSPMYKDKLDFYGEYKDLIKLMQGNNALNTRFSGGKSIIDLVTGEVFDRTLVPTAADMGKMTFGKSFVTYAKGKEVPLNTKFDSESVFTMDPLDASALYVAATKRKDLVEGAEVPYTNIPLLTAYKAQGVPVKIMDASGKIPVSFNSLDEAILKGKIEGINAMVRRSNIASEHKRRGAGKFDVDASIPEDQLKEYSIDEIARIYDVAPSFVEKADAMAYHATDIHKLKQAGILSDKDQPFFSLVDGRDPTRPRFLKAVADRKAVVNGRRLNGEVETLQRIKVQRDFVDKAVADYFKKEFENLIPHASISGVNQGYNVTVTDKSTGFLSSANMEFLSAGEQFQYMGRVNSRVKTAKDELVNTDFDSIKLRVAADDDAVYEAAALDTKLRRTASGNEFEFAAATPEDYLKVMVANGEVFHPDAVQEFLLSDIPSQLFDGVGNKIWNQEVIKKVRDVLKAGDPEEELDADLFLEVMDDLRASIKDGVYEIKNQNLADFWHRMVEHNGTQIVPHVNKYYVTQGGGSNLNPRALYATPIDTKQYPYHALVVPKGQQLMGSTEPGMIIAHSPSELQSRIAEARQLYGDDTIEILTDTKLEKYKKARNEYDASKLFRETQMDSRLKREGKFLDVTPEPNVNIFNQYTDALKKRHHQLVDNFMMAKYSEEVEALRRGSESIEQYGSVTGPRRKNKNVRNAYQDMLRLMLNKNADSSDTIWSQINTVTDEKFSAFVAGVRNAVNAGRVSGNWQLMNEKLSQYGLGDNLYSEANQLILSAVDAPKPIMAGITAKMNGIVSLFMLQLDNAHALVNAVSAPIMNDSTYNALMRAAKQDRIQVFQDGTVAKVEGLQGGFRTSGPLQLQAVKDVFGPNRQQLLEKYNKMGVITTDLMDILNSVEDFALLAGVKDVTQINKTLDGILEKLTLPNRFTEESVKLIAARMADLTADTLGLSEGIRKATINNFITTAHGNYLASQRPELFKGWAGQAIGLFQTYQFNLMQSLFRHVQAGDKTAVAKMMGLQAGIFGAQSLPGFQALNQYIGEKSADNNDFYSVTTGILGDSASNMLMYGLASNATVPLIGDGIDLYSRGDLTPRTPILIPTSLNEVPAVSVSMKAVGALTGLVGDISNGAPIMPAMLDAIGHSGFNRPLQGAAQLLAGERTTGAGMLLTTYNQDFRTYDMLDTWNAVTKLMGTRTLDEAVAASSYYRSLGYATHRQEQLNSLGEAYRMKLREGELGDAEYMEFADRYAAAGGNIENFSAWTTRQLKGATTSQINVLRERNNTPEGRYLQETMGAALPDYTNDGNFIIDEQQGVIPATAQ